jgi:pseudaminic acid synthase
VRCVRPGYGLPTKYLEQVLGRKTAKAVKRGTPLTWDLLA